MEMGRSHKMSVVLYEDDFVFESFAFKKGQKFRKYIQIFKS